MFKTIVDMVIFPLSHFDSIFLFEFVIFCLCMWIVTLVVKGFFNL